MDRITKALKATYNFFAGDAILLGAVVVAFALATILVHATRPLGKLNALTAVLFVAIIVGGLVTTLARELAGRPRTK